jgi:hypothetical protein
MRWRCRRQCSRHGVSASEAVHAAVHTAVHAAVHEEARMASRGPSGTGQLVGETHFEGLKRKRGDTFTGSGLSRWGVQVGFFAFNGVLHDYMNAVHRLVYLLLGC